MELERARDDIRYFYHAMYDWADLRKATKEVRCWEARCDGAEVALAKCEERDEKPSYIKKSEPLIKRIDRISKGD